MVRVGLLVLGLLVTAGPVHGLDPAPISGRPHVIDGDTLVISKIHVRLKGISAPELSERGGAESKAALVKLIKAAAVSCRLTGEQTRGRQVGYCSTPSGVDLNREMVAGGWALACPRFDERYVRDEPKSGFVQRIGYRLPRYCQLR